MPSLSGYVLGALAAILFISVACCGTPDRTPAPREAPWAAECSINVGPRVTMFMRGMAGLTYTAQRPVVVVIAPETLDKGGAFAQFVVRHELLHVIGWHGHPFAGPDDTVIYMDRGVPYRYDPDRPEAALEGTSDELPTPSALERDYMRQCAATIWITLDGDSPELIDHVQEAVGFWNAVAGREVFRIRASPATLK